MYLAPNQVFRNPSARGRYLFDAVVTPFAAAGAPVAEAPAYELRAYEALPQLLSATPSYDLATKELTVSGRLLADGRPREALDVDIYEAVNPNGADWKELGTAVTGQDGSYAFSTALASFGRGYVYTAVADSNTPTCPGASAQPAGCASISTDGGTSAIAKVAVRL